jgi:hypothetical protein
MEAKTRKRIYRWGGAFAGVVIFLALVVALLPFAARWGINHWFTQRGLQSEVQHISADWWNGEFTLTGLTVKSGQQSKLHIGELDVSLDLDELFDKRVNIRQLVLRDAFVDIAENDKQLLTVAGIVLGGGSKPAQEQSDFSEWSAHLQGVRLEKIEACYEGASKDKTGATNGCAKLQSLSWNGAVSYKTTTNRHKLRHLVSGNVDLALQGFEVKSKTGDIFSFTFNGLTLEDVNVDSLDKIRFGKVVFNAPSGTIKRTAKDGVLQSVNSFKMATMTLTDVGLTDTRDVAINNIAMRDYVTRLSFYNDKGEPGKDYNVQADQVSLNGITFSKLLNYDIDGIRFAGMEVSDEGKGDNPLLKAKAITASNFSIAGTNDIRLGGIAVREVGLFRYGKDATAVNPSNYRQYIKSATLSDLRIADLRRIALDSYVIDDADLTLVRDKGGEFVFDRPIAELVRQSQQKADREQTPQKEVTLQAKHFIVDGGSRIHLQDNSVEPAVKTTIQDINISVSDINTANAENLSPFKVAMVLGDYGRIDVEGKSTVFARQPTVEAKGKITGVDLVKFSPYADQVIQHDVQSGLLDAKLDINIKQGQLDSVAKITLQKFRIRPAPEKDSQYEQDLGMPLSTALSLLRDKDGSITVKLPVTGDITQPDFSLRDVIKDVMGDALKTAIINYYTPFGLVTVAGAAFDFITALRFQPVVFEPGTAQLDDAARAHIDEIATMLDQRPKVRLVLCGQAVLDDRIALFDIGAEEAQAMRSALQQKGEGGPDLSKLPELSAEQLARLESLARDRTRAVKDYFLREKGINPDRLIECNPKYDPADTGKPRTEVGV